jgi:hypothetical protein
MWNTNEIESSNSNRKFKLLENESPVSHRRFLELLAGDQNFVVFYNTYLKNCGFEAFFWENKPISIKSLDEDYECNLINSDYLAGCPPDSVTFQSYFRDDKSVVCFPNLGKDAQLVVPCPVKEQPVYTHIGNFVRDAGAGQINEFWEQVGEETLRHVGEKPRWLSTSGLGVFWLHVRIDSYPKYYQTEEYKSVPG